jgi:hypothetical protein
MRESGDRITSSGNFLQNLIAWVAFMVAPDDIEEFITRLVKNRGGPTVYKSARDGKKYTMYLAFEGDDTVGAIQEKIAVPTIEAFFTRWGWKSKLRSPKTDGTPDYLRFVGYDALFKNRQVVFDGANCVCCPQIKRLLQEKSWSTIKVEGEDLKMCQRVYAVSMANAFEHVEPMHRFMQALFDDNQGAAGSDKCLPELRDRYVGLYGKMGTDAEVRALSVMDFPDFAGSNKLWRALAQVSGGDYSEAEWACACSISTLAVHGNDAAAALPAAWLQP